MVRAPNQHTQLLSGSSESSWRRDAQLIWRRNQSNHPHSSNTDTESAPPPLSTQLPAAAHVAAPPPRSPPPRGAEVSIREATANERMAAQEDRHLRVIQSRRRQYEPPSDDIVPTNQSTAVSPHPQNHVPTVVRRTLQFRRPVQPVP